MDDATFDDYQQNYKIGVAEGEKGNNISVGNQIQDPSFGLKLHGGASSSSSSAAAADVEVDADVDYGMLPEEPPIGKDIFVCCLSVCCSFTRMITRLSMP